MCATISLTKIVSRQNIFPLFLQNVIVNELKAQTQISLATNKIFILFNKITLSLTDDKMIVRK